MKTGAYSFRWLILGVAAAAVAVHATEGEIVTLGEHGWREQAPALAVASGGTLMLGVLVPAALNTADVSIELWQVAGATLILLEKNRSFTDAVMAGSPNAQGVTVLRLAFPEVKRKTRMLVKFISAQDPQADAGRAQVWVYPPIDWAPVVRRFREANPRLVVFGESAGLREFLKTSGVAFDDRGTEPPEAVEAGTLAMGVVRVAEWRERKARLRVGGGRLLVFVPDAPGLPGVYTTVSGAGTITQVTLPVIENLRSDPRAADQFLQLIEQHLHAAPAALP